MNIVNMKTGIIILLTLFLAITAISFKVNNNTVNISDQETGTISLFNGKDLTGWGYRKKVQEKIVFEAFDGMKETNENRFFAKDGILTVKVSDQETGTISLFNGIDLTGWGYRKKVQEKIVFESFDGMKETYENRFFAKDGILTVNPYSEGYTERYGSIWTSREFMKDFILTLEFRASKNADSGIYLRGTQLQCRDYLVAGPYKNLKNYKPQEWNKIEVVVKNNIARCTCNDEILEEAMSLPVSGPIGLESDRGQMEYRNILIREL